MQVSQAPALYLANAALGVVSTCAGGEARVLAAGLSRLTVSGCCSRASMSRALRNDQSTSSEVDGVPWSPGCRRDSCSCHLERSASMRASTSFISSANVRRRCRAGDSGCVGAAEVAGLVPGSSSSGSLSSSTLNDMVLHDDCDVAGGRLQDDCGVAGR